MSLRSACTLMYCEGEGLHGYLDVLWPYGLSYVSVGKHFGFSNFYFMFIGFVCMNVCVKVSKT